MTSSQQRILYVRLKCNETSTNIHLLQAMNVHRFREQMDHYLNWRVGELTEKRVGSLMRKLIYRHLGWLVVWGCVFGLATGIVSQGLKISLNFNFLTR